MLWVWNPRDQGFMQAEGHYPPLVSTSSPLAVHNACVLLLPTILWYYVGKDSRGICFMISVAAAASYLLKARSRVAIVPGADGEVVPLSANWGHKHLKNKVTVRFRIPLQKLEKFCAEHKVSVAHVAVKAVATGLRSLNELNTGSLLGRHFHFSTVDVSCEVPIEDEQSRAALIKISSADTLSVSEIGQSIASQVAAIQDGTDVYCQRRDLILRYIPPALVWVLEEACCFLGARAGLDIPLLGIRPFPQGVCTILQPCRAEVRPMGTDVAVTHDSSTRPHSSRMLLTMGPVYIAPRVEHGVPLLPAYLPLSLSVRLTHWPREEERVHQLAATIAAVLSDPAVQLPPPSKAAEATRAAASY